MLFSLYSAFGNSEVWLRSMTSSSLYLTLSAERRKEFRKLKMLPMEKLFFSLYFSLYAVIMLMYLAGIMFAMPNLFANWREFLLAEGPATGGWEGWTTPGSG